MKPLQVGLLLFWSVLCISVTALAQDTASITGTVRDSSGGVVPDAGVSVSSAKIGLNRTTATNGAGDYLVAGLPAGSYNISISAKGFKEFLVKDYILRVAQKARIDANLTVGETTTQVVVEGQRVAQVETQSSEVAGTITGQEISQLMLNGRNFSQLIMLSPGVSNQTGQDEGGVGLGGNIQYSVNGGRFEYNNWEVDGGDTLDNGSNTTLNVYPSIEAIAEVRVLTSNYGAQYGRNASGTVEAETKSGTNHFHGNVYEFVRNDAFNSRNFFDLSSPHVPEYKKNDFGYTLGGPFFIPGHYNTEKDKTFFFWSEEWRKEIVPGQTFNQAVPSNAERMGDFSDLCPGTDCPQIPGTTTPFPNNKVPIDQANAGAILAMLPAPTPNVGNPCNSPTSSCFVASPATPTNWREELIRVDHNINSKWRAMVRYIHDSYNTINPTVLNFGITTSTFPTLQSKEVSPGKSFVARLTTIASSTLVNEFTFSYTSDHLFITNTGPWQRPSTMTMTGIFANGFGGKLPGVQLMGNAAYGGGFTEDPAFVPWNNSNPTYTYRDNVSKIVGKHNLQFGIYIAAAQKNEPNVPDTQGLLTFQTGTPVTTGNTFADLLIGNISSYEQTNKQVKYYNRYKIAEPYFQDDWRITSRLTLNLGLRLSLFGTYREKYKQAFNWEASAFNPANVPTFNADGSINGSQFNGIVQCGASGVPTGCLAGHLFNPAPRIGFAWDPWGKGKTAIRGGYGVFFEHANGNEANTESLENTPPLVQTSSQPNIQSILSADGSQIVKSGQTLQSGYNLIGGGGEMFPLSVISIGTKAIWPYAQQWNLEVQQEVFKNTVASIGYVGSKGTHLNLIRDLNQIPALPLSQNPFASREPIDTNPNPTMFPNVIPNTDCTALSVHGIALTPPASNNLNNACGNDANPMRPFLGFGTITLIENQANSIYNSLQLQLRRTQGPLNLNVTYTYSHSIDDASDRFDFTFVDSLNRRANRADSNFDQRHMFNLSYLYDLPIFSNSGGLTRTLLGGWQFAGITTIQTGTPFGVINRGSLPDGSSSQDNAGVANSLGAGSRPDLVGNPKAPLPAGANGPGTGAPLLYNPAAFAAPRGLTFGNASRNILRNPRRTNFDMALYKHFPIHESVTLEFRAEAFNIFNHTEFFVYNTFLGNGNNVISCYAGANNSAGDPSCIGNNFLRPAGAHRARTLQLGLKLGF